MQITLIESKERRIMWAVIAIACLIGSYSLLEPSVETLKLVGGVALFIVGIVYIRSAIRGYA